VPLWLSLAEHLEQIFEIFEQKRSNQGSSCADSCASAMFDMVDEWLHSGAALGHGALQPLLGSGNCCNRNLAQMPAAAALLTFERCG
jgi:hypothetical protein